MPNGKNAIRKSTVQGIILAVTSLCLTTLCLELAIRIYHGKVLHFESFTAEPVDRVGRMAYHARLGWVPRPGRIASDWTSDVDERGIRRNGRSISTASRPILAVGDSFTFGDEVEDSETWETHLEALLHKRVLNAGVSAYGIDQAFLRAELLLDQCHPDVVILSFISDDVNRTEFAYFSYGGWKPYFEFANGSLILRNVPVPQKLPPRRFQTLRHALGYSFLANAVLGRTAGGWWSPYNRIMKKIHNNGEEITVDLFVRLDNLVKKHGGQFIGVALATNGGIQDNARLPNVIKRAKDKGVEVLDLSSEILKLPAGQVQNFFGPSHHYSPAGNRWIADHVAAFLHEKGIDSGIHGHLDEHDTPRDTRQVSRELIRLHG